MNKNTQSINCDIYVSNLGAWGGKDFQLLPNSTYTLVIDYPFSVPGNFEIKVSKDGMGLIGLLSHVRKAYDKQYSSASKTPGQGYWHGIEDLYIEGITINHAKKLIKLSVGS
jgi:hypothetical protein